MGMNLGDYRVNFKDYKYIQEPRIYIWHEHNSGRTIARVFSTGEKAENCRKAYAKKSNQSISWCEGVFPVDIDRNIIKELYYYLYPTLEFQDELAEEGRKGRGKDKQPRTRRTKEEMMLADKCLVGIEPNVYQMLNLAYPTKKKLEEYINELIKKDILERLGWNE